MITSTCKRWSLQAKMFLISRWEVKFYMLYTCVCRYSNLCSFPERIKTPPIPDTNTHAHICTHTLFNHGNLAPLSAAGNTTLSDRIFKSLKIQLGTRLGNHGTDDRSSDIQGLGLGLQTLSRLESKCTWCHVFRPFDIQILACHWNEGDNFRPWSI